MGQYTGEILAIIAAVSCTVTALIGDIASHRIGAQTLNLFRMALSLVFLGILLRIVVGSPYPVYADAPTWFWLTLSGLVGFVFGDFCLFNSYVVFGSLYGQLFMTLAPPVAGIVGWLMLGEIMSWHSWLAMLVTLTGIAICILVRGEKGNRHKVRLKLPLRGILFGIGAGVGQGVGIVLSKIGLGHYSAAIPDSAPEAMSSMVPFAGTFIRALAGFVGFLTIITIEGSMGRVKSALSDRKGLTFATLTTLFGPVLGVSLSLMAVQKAEVGIVSTLFALTPVLIIAPYSIIHHQKITVKEIFGTLVSITGVAMFFLL